MGIEIGILNWIQNLHTPAADAVMCFVTRLGDGGILWILLIVLLFLIPKTRKSGIILAAALCVDLVLCNGVLKHLFYRIRPCDVNTAVQLLIPRPGDFSFPSGHTAASFAAVAALYGNPHLCWRCLSLFPGCICTFIILRIFWAALPSDCYPDIWVTGW